MENWEKLQYAKLIQKIMHSGQKRETRNVSTYSIFGELIEIDISTHFPLLNGRKLFYKPVLGELAAMLRGPKHIDDFKKFGCNYWNSWGYKKDAHDINNAHGPDEGHIEVDYGNAWLDFNGFNQLEDVVNKLQNNPADRRIIVSGWRPDRLDKLSLPCCHMLYQWYVRGDTLDMVWYQRSVDTMVGLPSDIILCAAWNIILANQCGYKPGVIKLVLGDTHIYDNHINGTLDYLRQLNNCEEAKVPYEIDPKATISNFRPEMLTLGEYQPQDKLGFELNV